MDKVERRDVEADGRVDGGDRLVDDRAWTHNDPQRRSQAHDLFGLAGAAFHILLAAEAMQPACHNEARLYCVSSCSVWRGSEALVSLRPTSNAANNGKRS